MQHQTNCACINSKTAKWPSHFDKEFLNSIQSGNCIHKRFNKFSSGIYSYIKSQIEETDNRSHVLLGESDKMLVKYKVSPIK